jgi:hypothetical protein
MHARFCFYSLAIPGRVMMISAMARHSCRELCARARLLTHSHNEYNFSRYEVGMNVCRMGGWLQKIGGLLQIRRSSQHYACDWSWI